MIILSDYQILTFFSVISRLLAKDGRGRRTNGGRVVGVSKLCTITRKTINSLTDCSSYFFLFACNYGFKVQLKWLTMTRSNNLDIVFIRGWKNNPSNLWSHVSYFSFVFYYSEKGSKHQIRGLLTPKDTLGFPAYSKALHIACTGL